MEYRAVFKTELKLTAISKPVLLFRFLETVINDETEISLKPF